MIPNNCRVINKNGGGGVWERHFVVNEIKFLQQKWITRHRNGAYNKNVVYVL